ncbi:MAG: type IV pilus secretin PilQ [Gammaproteobacteria bacterium]|nr:type IV pilus secretin PilQ [Gammaproteobacteria bacterium]
MLLTGIWGLMVSLAGAQESTNELQSIEFTQLPGQGVELRLQMSSAAPEPLSFTIDNPARIAIDLPGTSLGMASRRTDVGVGALNTVLAAEAGGRTRVVLNLDELTSYTTRVEGNSVVVRLEGASADSGSFATFGPAAGSSAPSAAGGRGLQDVDFRRGSDGSGMILVRLSDPGTPVDLRQEGTQVQATFSGASLPARLMRRLDVTDFATPVTTIDTLQVGGNTRMVVNATGNFEQLAYQSDNLFIIELKPVSESAAAAMEDEEKKVYTGERLTLNFQDIETRAVLQLLADTSGLNIVVSDTVAGNVTLRLQNVPWDQALDIVLRTKGLDMRQNDNVIIVAPAEEIAERERRELESRKQIEELVPLRSEFIQVNYAKAGELASLIGGGNALLSERGNVAIDERTNTLLVQDTAEKLAEIRRLVRQLDIPIRQVLIESRIVIANDDFSRELGVRMGATAVTDNSSDGLIAVSGSASGTGSIVDSGLDNLQTSGQPFPVGLPAQADRFNVNLPVANPSGRVALAILDSDYLIDLELAAMQSEGRGEVISTPRVVTSNQKRASIEQGVEIPYQEASSSGATATQFKEAVLRLEVTPQITPDDRIIMDLLISNDSVGELVASATGGFVPSIDTNEVNTQVLVKNGETVVLGGIYITDRRNTESKVPYLGDLPVLGKLFKSSQRQSNKSELLVFVTPKILKEGTNIK